MLNINPEFVGYAKVLSDLGDVVIDASGDLQNVKPSDIKTVADVDAAFQKVQTTLAQFNVCKQRMIEMSRPRVVEEEHQEMVRSFQKYIDGTTMMFEALTITNREAKRDEEFANIDVTKILNGLSLQQTVGEEMEKIVGRIALKLGSI